MGNLQVRFLEGWAPAMAPGYSTLIALRQGSPLEGVGLFSRALVVLPDVEVRKGHVRSFPRFITGLQQGFTSLSRKFIFPGTFHPCPSQRWAGTGNTSFVKEKRDERE